MPEPTTEHHDEKKKGGMFEGKKKWYWIGGGVLLLVVIYLAVKRSNQNSNAKGTQQPAGLGASAPIDPATGFPEGSAADLAALGFSGTTQTIPGSGGSMGPPGPAGPPGPPGPPGPGGDVHGPPTIPPHLQPGGPARRPTHKGNTMYTVKAGDTLTSIAKQLHLADWQVLYKANRGVIGSNPNMIHPGERLIVPTGTL